MQLRYDGKDINVFCLKMYPKKDVLKALAMREYAVAKMGIPLTSGVGFIGNSAWSVGGGLALGFLEILINKGAQKEGVSILEKSQELLSNAIACGGYVNIHSIYGLESDDLSQWEGRLVREEAASVENMSQVQIDKFCYDRGVDASGIYKSSGFFGKIKIINPIVKYNVVERYCLIPGDFVEVQSDAGEMRIRWSSVSSYCPPDMKAVTGD